MHKSVFEAAPFLSFTDILPPMGAGKDGESTTSLAPFGGKLFCSLEEARD
jgi:hypothetical protein